MTMIKTLGLAGALVASVAGASAPAAAQAWGGPPPPAYGYGYGYDRGYDGYRGYDDRGPPPPPIAYRGYDRHYAGDYRRCHRDGTGGAILGAIAGGLFGSALAGRSDRGAGVVLGAGAGALAGSAIARSDRPYYCR